MKKCPDCLANFSDNFQHTCPPWLKEIVKRNKEKLKKKSNVKTLEKKIKN